MESESLLQIKRNLSTHTINTMFKINLHAENIVNFLIISLIERAI